MAVEKTIIGPTDSDATASAIVKRDTGGRFKVAAATDPEHPPQRSYVDNFAPSESSRRYGVADHTTLAAPGTVLAAQRYSPVLAGLDDFESLPGFLGPRFTYSAPAPLEVPLLPPATRLNSTQYRLAGLGVRGIKYSTRGVLKAADTTKFNAAYELLGVGALFYLGDLLSNNILPLAATAETTRDGAAGVSVNVDAAEAMQKTNHATSGDASYTSVGEDTDISTRMRFEVVVETPSTAAAVEDNKVTVKLENDAGSLITAHDEVAPVQTGTSLPYIFPYIVLNVEAYIEQLEFEVRRVA